jgi:transglutaminase-like putative cysteine protease
MAILYEVEHVTTYRYASRVSFGPHRAMFLPRSGPYGRILSHSVTTNLRSRVRWIIDALSNVVTLIDIDEPGAELTFTFKLRGIHYGVAEAEAFPVEQRAEAVPVQYTPESGTTSAAIFGRMPRTRMALWQRGPSPSPSPNRTMPPMSSGACSTRSARRSPTRHARAKGRSRRVRRCDRSRAPAATTPG